MLPNPFRRLFKDRRGGVAMLVAIMGAMLIAFAGLAVEVSNALQDQRHMQSAADSAALAAATASFTDGSTGPWANEGYAVAGNAGFTSSTNTCDTISGTVTDTVYVGAVCPGDPAASSAACTTSGTTCVEALIKKPFTLSLAHVLFPGNFVVHGRAIAFISANSVCAAILDPTDPSSFVVNGGGTTIFHSCPVYVNSTAANAAKCNGCSGTVTCDLGLFVGGDSSPDPFSGTCTTHPNQPAVVDPLRNINPSFMGTAPTIAATVAASLLTCPTGAGNCSTITPGANGPNTPVYIPKGSSNCTSNSKGGITMSGANAICYVCPGVYIVDAKTQNAQFTVTSGSLLSVPTANLATECVGDSGDATAGIAFVLTDTGCTTANATCTSVPTPTIGNGATVNLTRTDPSDATKLIGGLDAAQASASGLPNETVFWQNRNATTGVQNTDKFTGLTTLSGLLYFPTGNVSMNGSATPTIGPCLEIIAYTLTISGSNTLGATGCVAPPPQIPPPSTLID